MPHLDAIARECFEEEAWQRSPKVGMFGVMASVYGIALVVTFVMVPGDYLPYGIVLACALPFGFIQIYLQYAIEVNTLACAIAAAFTSPRYVSRRMRAYRLRDTDVVVRVCAFSVQKYRDQIASEQERALGDKSQWTRKRGEIARAADGAGEAAAYWTERTQQEPGSPRVEARLAAATGLSEKLTLALAALDQRAQAIGAVFDQCHDKVDALEQRVGDVDKIRQLGKLSDTAGNGQALAAASVKAIAEELREEAEGVSDVLKHLSKLEVATALEDAEDNVEQLADEIVVESERVNKAIADLDLAPNIQSAADIERPAQSDQTPERQPAAVEVAEPKPKPAPAPQRPAPIRPARPRSILLEPSVSLERPKPLERSKLSGPPTSPSPARMSDAEEERQMKELVVSLRRLADVQERKAHDLRFRDDLNSEAYDREELAEKMTELADEIELFFAVKERMKEWRAQNT